MPSGRVFDSADDEDEFLAVMEKNEYKMNMVISVETMDIVGKERWQSVDEEDFVLLSKASFAEIKVNICILAKPSYSINALKL